MVLTKEFRFAKPDKQIELLHFRQAGAKPKRGPRNKAYGLLIELDHLTCAQSKLSDLVQYQMSPAPLRRMVMESSMISPPLRYAIVRPHPGSYAATLPQLEEMSQCFACPTIVSGAIQFYRRHTIIAVGAFRDWSVSVPPNNNWRTSKSRGNRAVLPMKKRPDVAIEFMMNLLQLDLICATFSRPVRVNSAGGLAAQTRTCAEAIKISGL
jgi:hypothetical protein